MPSFHFTTILLQGDRFFVNLHVFKTQMVFCTRALAFAKSQTYSFGSIFFEVCDVWLKTWKMYQVISKQLCFKGP